jgi:hypothetical protein
LAYRVRRADAIAKMLWLPSVDPGKNCVDATNRFGQERPEAALRLAGGGRGECFRKFRLHESDPDQPWEPVNYKLDIKQAAGCAAKVAAYIVRPSLVESGGRSLFCNIPR